ncbi:DUF4255 domain-containing protein [Streptomyces morookaense]|uniref:DUF4255 domain-containing protein n=1 Tax=Streptomyces morookaense TaxID=1970 RepID=A0A7Y7E570_STRMO|nr:DUF4255 domain-containing protein [Streptomyces morookaense]NVK76410.1 DUF4255 domain-containing protein [Streptomyces morookaense]GHF06835.1 hypothetical protein GCM10010359_04910 [Streptomyces morookaense]
MIQLVDQALKSRVRQDMTCLPPGFPVTFQPPGRDTGLGETTGSEAVGIYLYDIREALERRQTGTVYQYAGPPGDPELPLRKSAQFDPPRYARLSYLVAAWAPDALIAHAMLGDLLVGFARSPQLPVQLPPELEDMDLAALLDVGHPPSEDRALTELWSAVGHTLVPTLNVTVTLPLLSFVPQTYTHWVTEDPVVTEHIIDEQAEGNQQAEGDRQ